MLTDLFQLPSPRLNRPLSLPLCGACGLYKGCRSPKMKVSGKGRRKILVVGEAPGADEDLQGRPFVGKAGEYLRRVCERVGIDLRSDCWITNALICRPPKNRTPTAKEINYCRPNVVKTIEELKPETVILLGAPACKSVLQWLWPTVEVSKMGKWAGWRVPCQKLNAWLCPTYHPSYIVRSEDKRGRLNEVLELMFADHLRAAVSLKGRPWAKVPDHPAQVTVEMSPERAARSLHEFRIAGIPCSIDIETDRLKPDMEEALIVSCAVSDGSRTVSYPWFGPAIKATAELLNAGVPMIGYNTKFEARWFATRIGVNKVNWAWDGILAAHALDSRGGTKGLDFQALVRLGEPDWSSGIDPYLRNSKGKKSGNAPNRIRELDLRTLLLYGGVDALLEWKLAYKQAELLGMKIG